MVEVKVLREENLAAAERLYEASVRDNPQGFIQQLYLFSEHQDVYPTD